VSAVAEAVAWAAHADGLAQVELDDPAEHVAQAMWAPAREVIEPV
jgi:hypothetical protein